MIGRVMSACVELTPELEKLVEVELKAGRFLSAADFLSKAALKSLGPWLRSNVEIPLRGTTSSKVSGCADGHCAV